MKRHFTAIENTSIPLQGNHSAIRSNVKIQTPNIQEKNIIIEPQIPVESIKVNKNRKQCNICLTGNQTQQQLIYVCRCIQPIHLSCLQEWIFYKKLKLIRDQDLFKCTKCRQTYSIEIDRKWRIQLSLLTDKKEMLLLYGVFFFIQLTVLTLLSVLLYRLQDNDDSKAESNKQLSIGYYQTKVILICSLIFITFLFLYTLYLFISRHLVNYKPKIKRKSIENNNFEVIQCVLTEFTN